MTSKKYLEELKKACKTDIDRQTFKKIESLHDLIKNENEPLLETHETEFEDVFSRRIIAFYETIPEISLRFACSLVADFFKRIFSISMEDGTKVEPWERVFRLVITGLEAYTDSTQEHSRVGEIFYKPLFGIMSSPAGLKLSTRLKNQAKLFGLLSYLAETSSENKQLLQKKTICGASRLGVIIAATNEYSVLVILFQLLENMLSDNPDQYATAGKEVFQNPKSKKTFGKEGCDKLLKLFKEAAGIKWDLITDRLIRAMATLDKEKPKPFSLASREIRVNDQTFLYPRMLQSMYIDNTAFTLNIGDGDDIDSLDIAFKTVTSIHLKAITSSKVTIILDLSSPPVTATELASSKTNTFQVIFEINSVDLQEFKEALTSRGLEMLLRNLAAPQHRSKISVADQPLDLNHVSTIPLELKSIQVEQFYNTSTPEKITSPKDYLSEAKLPDIVIDPPRDIKTTSSTKQGGGFVKPFSAIKTAVPETSRKPKTENTKDAGESRQKPAVAEQIINDPPKSLKRKRGEISDIEDDNPPNEVHYNSQYLTMKVPISNKKYKARNRKLDSPQESQSSSSISSEDVVILQSPVCEPKPLKKLNVDRPSCSILPPDLKKVDKKNNATPVPPAPAKTKPRPKPISIPKKRMVIVDSDSNDESCEPPKKGIFKVPISSVCVSNIFGTQNPAIGKCIDRSSTSPQMTTEDKRKPALTSVPVAASSPFNDGKLALKPFNDEYDMPELVDEDEPIIHLPNMELGAETSDGSEESNDSDYEVVDVKGPVLLQDHISKQPVKLAQEHSSLAKTLKRVVPPLKSALKNAIRSEPAAVELDDSFEDDDKNEDIEVGSEPDQAPIRISKYYAIDATDRNEGLVKPTGAPRVPTKRTSVSFEKHTSNRTFDRSLLSAKPKVVKKVHSIAMPQSPVPFEEILKRSCSVRSSKFVESTDSSSASVDEDVGTTSTDQNLGTVLNKIHEAIVENLGKKFKHSTTCGNAITNKLRIYAAEDLERMLQASLEHRQNLVAIEERYAQYGRQVKNGLEGIEEATLAIQQTLQQAIENHDTMSLVRKMPRTLVERPKLLSKLNQVKKVTLATVDN